MVEATLTPETAPLRELLEVLHEEVSVLHAQLESARDRERFWKTIVEGDRAEIQRLRTELERLRARRPPPSHHSAITHEAAARPVAPIAAAVRREPSALHAGIMAALEEACPMTARQLEAALDTTRPLADTLSGLARRGVLVRVGAGRFALPVGAPALNGVEP
jgi:hypothetical protein